MKTMHCDLECALSLDDPQDRRETGFAGPQEM
jgi:hypothetical protein